MLDFFAGVVLLLLSGAFALPLRIIFLLACVNAFCSTSPVARPAAKRG